jgi:hypothetical protein
MKKANKTRVVETEPNVPPMIEEGQINVIMSREDVKTFISFLNICSQTFETLALQAVKQNDENLYAILSARQKLSNIYMMKLVNNLEIGEPTSRELH